MSSIDFSGASADGALRTGGIDRVTAAIIRRPGVRPHIAEVVLPPHEAGTTLLDVVAAPLNPLDLLIASGEFHSARHDSPYVPGGECVGIVAESEVYPIGSMVYAECHPSPETPGALATRVRVHDYSVLPLPVGIDPILAAAVGNSGVAAYLPLIDVAGLRHGNTVLILGATGAVGQLAIQISRLMGAGRVVGVARDQQALDRVLSIGADAVVCIGEGDGVAELAARFVEAAGPVDIVLDGLFGAPLEAALVACQMHARVVNIGHLAGATAEISAGVLRGKQLTVSGFAGLHLPLEAKRAALNWLWEAAANGFLELQISTVPLSELPSAWDAQALSPHAKYVVQPRDTTKESHR